MKQNKNGFIYRLKQAWNVLFQIQPIHRNRLVELAAAPKVSEPWRRQRVKDLFHLPDESEFNNMEFDVNLSDYPISNITDKTKKIIIELIIRDLKEQTDLKLVNSENIKAAWPPNAIIPGK